MKNNMNTDVNSSVHRLVSAAAGSQQAKRGAEDGQGERGEEAAGGAEGGASLASYSKTLAHLWRHLSD